MKWLEIIEIRITGKDHDLVGSYLTQLYEQITKESKHQIKILNKYNLDTDFSIHLKHDSSEIKQSGSTLGQSIIAVLKEHGMVNHTIWMEMKIDSASSRDKKEQ